MLVKKWDDKVKGYIFIEVEEKPPSCYKCMYRTDLSGSCCDRIITDSVVIHNIITGEDETHHHGPACQSERYSDNQQCCGIEGRFFKSIPKPRAANPGEAITTQQYLEQNI